MVPANDSIIEIEVQPSETVDLEDQIQILRGFIDQLEKLDKAIIILYLDGNTYDLIAEILGISESNVGTRINRIKQKLQHTGADLSKKGTLSWTSIT